MAPKRLIELSRSTFEELEREIPPEFRYTDPDPHFRAEHPPNVVLACPLTGRQLIFVMKTA